MENWTEAEELDAGGRLYRVKPLQWQYILLEGNKIPRLNPSNPRLKLFTEVCKHLPVGLATLLGPQIVRHLP